MSLEEQKQEPIVGENNKSSEDLEPDSAEEPNKSNLKIDEIPPDKNTTDNNSPNESGGTDEASNNEASNSSSQIGRQLISQSRDGTTINIYEKITGISDSQDDESTTISLYNESFPLIVEPQKKIDEDVEKLAGELKENRIIILGDSGDGYANSVARYILSTFDIDSEENLRLLRIVGNKEETLGIESLTFERKEEQSDDIQDVFVIVDASKGAESTGFADSLLNPAASDSYYYPSILRKNKFYIICILKNEDIEEWISKGSKQIYPLKVFARKVSSDEPEKNVEEIQMMINKIFNSDDQIDFLIVRTVCFVASFFPNLTVGDFNELVDEWLKLESISLDVISPEAALSDTIAKYKSLDNIWKSKSHVYLETCFLKQKKDHQNQRIIGFENSQYKEQIKEKFESYHWAFVEEKADEILKIALFFKQSNNIANQSMSLYVDYLPGNEEKLLNWLLWVFDTLNAAEQRDESLKKLIGINDSGVSSENEEITSRYYYYKRLEELFRKILRKPLLNNQISTFIKSLLYEGYSQSALKIVKLLKSASDFDEVHWFKQIYERGDQTAKKEIQKYYFKKIKNSDFAEAVEKLKDWLPADDKDRKKHSGFNAMALNLMVEYFSYVTERYDEKLYGIEPTKFELLSFEDKESAEVQIDKIICYLIHPTNQKLDLQDISYLGFVAILIEIWNKILCKNNFSQSQSVGLNQNISNSEIINLILKQIISHTDKKFQENILSAWKELKVLYNDMKKMSPDWESREKLTDDYEMLINLVENFKLKQWENL